MDNSLLEMFSKLFSSFNGGVNSSASQNSFSQQNNPSNNYYPKEAYQFDNQNNNYNQNNNFNNSNNLNNNNTGFNNLNLSGLNLNNILPMLLSMNKTGSLTGILEALSSKNQNIATKNEDKTKENETIESIQDNEILL